MRSKLSDTDKRGSQIGIKVKRELKAKIKFISDREARPMSTQINVILENYVEQYLEKNKLNWLEYAPQYIDQEGGE